MTKIASANLKWYRSTGDLGGAITGTEVVPASLFDYVTGDEALAGDTEYRCVYFKNTDANVNGLIDAKLWILTQTPAQDYIEIALDPVGKNGVADVITNENTAPDALGIVFTDPDAKIDGLSLGTLASGDYYAVWIKRVVPAGCEAYNANSFTLKVEGDTTA